MLDHLIGKRSTPIKNKIEEGAIKRFAMAIGDPQRIYFDEEFARTTPHKKIVAPPTFPRTIDFGEIEGLNLPAAGLIHGEQTFKYKCPLYAGDIVYASCELLSFQKKQGMQGLIGILKIKQYGYKNENENNIIFSSVRTLILTEQLLKEVNDIEK